MSVEIKISLNEGVYLKDPQDSRLGRNIIKHGILLIEELGFEAFNFKKLAKEIGSTEASVYRYFENKHALLIYLVSWYWQWVSYLIKINTLNLDDPKKKLKIIINSFVSASVENPSTEYIDENKLHSVVIAEGTKAYRTKGVDDENGKGFFKNYKQLIAMVAAVILEINPTFEYPHAMASNLFEMSNDHIYFAKHLPRLTDIKLSENTYPEVEEMLNYFASKLLGYKA
ncbi:TetR/AcrR family transcriptional regulator [Subsaximicrobium wynnwilliamsii]|uniref:TetR/AcrR family transcriptional regulator n=1 Tax=Subsaximicrobium wynnwilliamsii TaxID=291179 RepID=A0A5C6ZLY7_9FLAO|nr:TetR/AcrR family transcriptional regulator [Subsaximicrobium wynnwilliamsii]TXD85053.1 TetR/AcrR family transcriptional regulator [Subsaximicrobium wynnwilliamsii]TXD91096.1 TetR/AcrR family transcriptional regulator [Subsaximicrobium wynnwilliamsii]TXE04490.1 TetR/AcrR family transcriptional regulator [Subsaximicrobium wynnwilliamsii]